MNTEEQNFWSSLRRSLPYDIWAQRIENGLIPGMPDVFVSGKQNKQSWLELKVAHVPVKRTTPWMNRKDVRLAQLNWHIKATTYSIPTFVALRGIHRDGKQTIHLVPGHQVPQIHCFDEADWNEYRFDSYSSFWEEFR